jgi:hypothetical protein
MLTMKGEDGTVCSDSGAEQRPFLPIVDWTQEKVGVMRLELRRDGTPRDRVNNGRSYGGRSELRGACRFPQCGVATCVGTADEYTVRINGCVLPDCLDRIDAVGYVQYAPLAV